MQVQATEITTFVYGFSSPVWVRLRPAPTGVKAETYSATAIKLTWKAVPTADMYEVQRATSKTGSYTTVKKVYSGTTFIDTSRTPGVTYYYKVQAMVKRPGYTTYHPSSLPSSPVLGIALGKTSISRVSALGRDRVTLGWAAVSGATGYKLLRSRTAGGTYSLVKNVYGTSLTVTGLSPNTAYFFKVQPFKKVGTTSVLGPLSAYRSVRTLK